MRPIPNQYHEKYLLFLNDFIQNNAEYNSVCTDREITAVNLLDQVSETYTIISFRDGCDLIIPNVFKAFLSLK